MSPRAAKLASRGLLGLAVAMAVATFAISISGAGHRISAPIVVGDRTVADGPQVLADIQRQIANGTVQPLATGANGLSFGFVLALLWLSTGSLIVSRQPKNLAGWLISLVGLAWVAEWFGVALVAWSLVGGPSLPARDLFAAMGDESLAPILLLPLLFLLFPDGRPPSPRWRWAMWALIAGVALWSVGYMLSPGPLNNFVDAGILYVNPLGVRGLETVAPVLAAIGGITIVLAALATVPAVRGRYKRSAGEERQQLRWLVAVATLAGALLAILVLAIFVFPDGADERPIINIFFTAVFVLVLLTLAVGVPAAYLVAIVKHGLWDLNVVIKKAAVALALTLVIGLPILLFLAVASQLLVWAVPRPKGVPIYTLIGGVGLGLLIVPIVRVSRRIATRITYGRRATQYEVLTAFGERVGETYSVDDVLPRMVQVLAKGTGATSARVLLRVGGTLREEAAFGEVSGNEHIVPVMHLGEDLGALAATFPPNDPLDRAKERLMENLATQAGLVLRNVRLIEELRASRQRLVAAQDEERRKIERNIHDGAQQQLVALSVKLRLAEQIADQDSVKVKDVLSQLQGETSEAIENLRDLARGIYPPLLADQGLVTALEAQAGKSPIPVELDPDSVGRYPQEVEAAVYFCMLEALQNASKYSRAGKVSVGLRHINGVLTFEVRDDGDGFDQAATGYGTGLQGMADRLDAIGGALEIRSAPGQGTTVLGRVSVG